MVNHTQKGQTRSSSGVCSCERTVRLQLCMVQVVLSNGKLVPQDTKGLFRPQDWKNGVTNHSVICMLCTHSPVVTDNSVIGLQLWEKVLRTIVRGLTCTHNNVHVSVISQNSYSHDQPPVKQHGSDLTGDWLSIHFVSITMNTPLNKQSSCSVCLVASMNLLMGTIRSHRNNLAETLVRLLQSGRGIRDMTVTLNSWDSKFNLISGINRS